MLLTVRETSEMLKVNRNKVYELINSGLLPYLKLGSIKIRYESLQEFLSKYEGCDIDSMITKG